MNEPRKWNRTKGVASLIMLFAGLQLWPAGPQALAGVYTYSTTSTSTTWENSNNWTGGPANTFCGADNNASSTADGAATDVATFTTWSFGASLGINMNTSANSGVGNNTGANGLLQFGALNFSGTKSALALGNNSTWLDGVLQLNGATVDPGSGPVNNMLVSVSNAATQNLTIQNAVTGGNKTMPVRLGVASGVMYVNTGRSLTISSNIAELNANSSIYKQGGGTLSLAGTNNSFSGGVTIGGGVLGISNSAALGSGTLTLANTASATFLRVTSTAATPIPNDIVLPAPGSAQTYTLLKTSAGSAAGTQLDLAGNLSGGGSNATLALNTNITGDNTTTFRLGGGNNTFRATLNLNYGGLVVANSASLGNSANLVYLNSPNNPSLGNLRFEDSMTLPNPIQLQASATISTGGNTVVLNGLLSGGAPLNKTGAGSLIIAGSTTYTGATTVSGGTLQFGNGGTTGRPSPQPIVNHGVLAFNRLDNMTVGQGISGTGSLVKLGSNALTLSGSNGYQGGTIVLEGTLIFSRSDGLADGTSLIVGDAGLFPPSPIIPESSAPAAAEGAITAVPEPGGFVLLAAACWAALARLYVQRRVCRGN